MAHRFLRSGFDVDQLFSREWVPDETACDSYRGRPVRGRDYILPPPGLREGGFIPPLCDRVAAATASVRRRQASVVTLPLRVSDDSGGDHLNYRRLRTYDFAQ